MTDEYCLKTQDFCGPLGLLLSLIEKKKLFVNDFSLAQVTEDYLNYLNKHDMATISNFVLVASTLILIKSKSLLPNLDLTSEEEGEIKDLEERLKLYEHFCKLSENIRGLFGKKIIFYPQKDSFIPVFLPDQKITPKTLHELMRDLLQNIPQYILMAQELKEVTVKKIISIEEVINRLKTRIEQSLKINFSDFAKQNNNRKNNEDNDGKNNDLQSKKEEKIFIIVSFLALLELVRQGILEANQEEKDIVICNIGK